VFFGTTTSDEVQLGSNGAVGLTIDTAQQVGIGDTTPDGRLDVVSTVEGEIALRVGTTDATPTGEYLLVENSGGTDLLSFDENNVLYTSGTIGIDKASPDEDLHIFGSGTTGATIELETDNAGDNPTAYIRFYNNLPKTDAYLGIIPNDSDDPTLAAYTGTLGDAIFLGTTNAYATQLGANGGVGLTVDTSQQIGIGDNTPDAKLDVYNSGATTVASHGQIIENVATNTTTDAINKYGLHVTSTGSFTGLGGTATNNYGLYVATPTGADNNYAAAFQGGNVGIGTLSPDEDLHIYGASSAGATIHLETTNGGDTPEAYIYINNTTVADGYIGIIDEAGHDPADVSYTGTLADAFFLGSTNANSELQLGSNGAVRLSIATDGTIDLSGYDCSGDANDGALTVDGSGNLICSDDDGGSSSPFTDGGDYIYSTNSEDLVSGNTADPTAQLTVDNDTAADNVVLLEVHASQSAPVIFVDQSGSSDELFRIDVDEIQNFFAGYGAGASNNPGTGTEGLNNTFIGYLSGTANGIGEDNTAVGASTLQYVTSSYGNSAFGAGALNAIDSGSHNNTALGYYALGTATSNSIANVAVGRHAGYDLDGGDYNFFAGNSAGENTTTGSYNIAIGDEALGYNLTGSSNVAIGLQAGRGAAADSITGNTLLGYYAGNVLEGNYNTFIGYGAGDNATTAAFNIVIGNDINLQSATDDNTLIIGNTIFGTGISDTGSTIDTDAKIGIGDADPEYQLTVSRTNATNDAPHESFGTKIGSDGTLGSLNVIWGGVPSATGGDRYGFITVGDTIAMRDLILNYDPFGGYSGNVAIGTTTASANLHVSNGSTNLPSILADTDVVIDDTDSTTSDAILSLIGGTASGAYSIINFGDSGDENVGRISYDHGTNTFNIRTDADGTDALTIDAAGHATFQVNADAADAFQIIDGSVDEILTADTTNNRIKIGDDSASAGSDTTALVLDTATTSNQPTGVAGAMYYNTTDGDFYCYRTSWSTCDTSGPSSTRHKTLIPEFAGGLLVADGSNNSGTMSAGHVTGLAVGQGYHHNYYQWTTASGTAQDYDIVVNYQLPSDFDATNEFKSSSWKVWTYSDTLADTTATITIEDQNRGTVCVSSENVETTTVSTWEQKTLSGNPNTSCTFAPDDIITITIKLGSSNSSNIRLGEISFEYDT